MRLICAWVLIIIVLVAVNAQENPMPNSTATSPQLSWVNASSTKLERELIAKYGEAQRPRLERGLHQVTEFWRPEDGDAAAFEEFVRANFAGDQAALDPMFTVSSACSSSLPATCMKSIANFASKLISTLDQCFHLTKCSAATILRRTSSTISFRTSS